MDDMVLRAMTRWPNVPAVFGWLSLDRRGRFRLRGEPIAHPGVLAFMARNYGPDAHGRWFFQNGPQRVYVALEYTPLVLRTTTGARLSSHTGRAARPRAAWLDDEGAMLLATDVGPGVVDDRDLAELGEAIVDASGHRPDDDRLESLLEQPARAAAAGLRLRLADTDLELGFLPRADAPAHLGYDPQPTPDTPPLG
ncbi:MAG: DUF2946 family protein [Ectothiorhodospiraceae bacterium]|nr:DUF2946 family protein [Chromatiales bacterium]MCP5157562.1 DUF2946 family protein [Ectothiorhodospiraceae bacterium]